LFNYSLFGNNGRPASLGVAIQELVSARLDQKLLNNYDLLMKLGTAQVMKCDEAFPLSVASHNALRTGPGVTM